jgi:hypothetical protein
MYHTIQSGTVHVYRLSIDSFLHTFNLMWMERDILKCNIYLFILF